MYDVVIIGAGPAGASAAVFTARAGLSTLVVDADQGLTRRAWLPNHLGFPEGISGPELVDKGYEHARLAGAQLQKAKVKALKPQEQGVLLETEDGQQIEAKQVILATGGNLSLAREAGAAVSPGREPHFPEVVAVDGEGRTTLPNVWAAGACAGTSVHTIITAGDGARVAINLVSAVKGTRYVDHEVMKK